MTDAKKKDERAKIQYKQNTWEAWKEKMDTKPITSSFSPLIAALI